MTPGEVNFHFKQGIGDVKQEDVEGAEVIYMSRCVAIFLSSVC
jgi:hypothetical protein